MLNDITFRDDAHNLLGDLGAPPWERTRTRVSHSQIITRFNGGVKFSFGEKRRTDLARELLMLVIGYCSDCDRRQILLVCKKWNEVADCALRHQPMKGLPRSNSSQQLIKTSSILTKKIRGTDCLDPSSYENISFSPFCYQFCPSVGPFSHRILKFTFDLNRMVIKEPLSHPYGKVSGGCTYFYFLPHVLSNPIAKDQFESDFTRYCLSLFMLSPMSDSIDSCLYNPWFKLVSSSILDSDVFFKSQRLIRGTSFVNHPCKVYIPTGLGNDRGENRTCVELVCMKSSGRTVLMCPPGVVCGEVRNTAREHLQLSLGETIFLFTDDCCSRFIDDWQIISQSTLRYIICASGLQQFSAIGCQELGLYSPDFGYQRIGFDTTGTLGTFKSKVKEVFSQPINTTVMIQARPGVILEGIDSQEMSTYVSALPRVLVDDGLLLVYLGTTNVMVTVLSEACELTIQIVVGKSWSVQTLLSVTFSAVRLVKECPDNSWCSHVSGRLDLLKFPSRQAAIASKVSINGGRFLDSNDTIECYWKGSDNDKTITVHFDG